MKKIAALLLVIILLSASAFTVFGDNTIYTEGALYYRIGDMSIIITGYFGREAEVHVPNMVAGYPVNEIAKGAFVNTNAKVVYLPDTIMKTEEGAFGEDVSVVFAGTGPNATPFETSHNWDSGKVIKLPTCKETGILRFTCTICGKTQDAEIPVSNEHSYDHSCDDTCNVCGHKRSITHTPGNKVYSDSTGHWRYCSVCGKKIEFEKHISDGAATETKPEKCKICGFIINPVKAHTHKLTKVEATKATATQPGNIEYYKCSGCSKIFADAAGKKEISYSDLYIAPLGVTPIPESERPTPSPEEIQKYENVIPIDEDDDGLPDTIEMPDEEIDITDDDLESPDPETTAVPGASDEEIPVDPTAKTVAIIICCVAGAAIIAIILTLIFKKKKQ